ncbi:MAG: Uma2 family endonuclease [Candidatus Electrothrix sp. MAN1_4]|nr:Uma2 family endonuclease [Candidatus Electrothrix sp. MAN1_4]
MNWQQICTDSSLQNLPYKIELNRQGQIIMSPANVRHAILQAKIIALLNKQAENYLVVPGFPVETSDGVKVADVGLLAMEQAVALKDNVTSAVAPKVCVEVLSPSNNTLTEMQHKKELYFEQGAQEFWICDQTGCMSFYGRNGEIKTSRLVAEFSVDIDL